MGVVPSGSVIPRQNLILPSATPGRNLDFCSGVPKFTIGGTPIPLPPPRLQFTPEYPYLVSCIQVWGGLRDIPRETFHLYTPMYAKNPIHRRGYRLVIARSSVQLPARGSLALHVV